MDPFELHRLGLTKHDTQAAFRRQVWLQIYLPLGLGIVGLAALITFTWRSQAGDASVWADVSLMMLLFVGFMLGLLLLAVLTAVTVGVWYVVRELPQPFRRARIEVARAGQAAEQAADKTAAPMIVPKAAWHTVRSTVRYLAGIFSRRAA